MDVEALESHLKHSSGDTQIFSTSKKWLRATIDEVKGNRKRIVELEAEVLRLRAALDRHEMTAPAIHKGAKKPSPKEEAEEILSQMDKTFSIMGRMFERMGLKK